MLCVMCQYLYGMSSYGQKYPAVQSCAITAPSGQIFPAGQTSHSHSKPAPTLSMTRPGGHVNGVTVPRVRSRNRSEYSMTMSNVC